MLAWTDGAFSFSAIDVDMNNRVNQSTMKLLMDGAQLLDERAEAARRRLGQDKYEHRSHNRRDCDDP